MESTLVIKVKYGDTLRRFNASVNENDQLDLDIGGLRSKILGLFNFPLDADLTLTYVDEDGDVVTLVDDDDLHDVTRQCLKFLRIDVQLNDKFGKSYARSSGSSTPMRSPHVQYPLPNLNTGVADVMRLVPEPLHETLSKLSLDLASKAATSSPVLAELIDCVSKMVQPYLSAGHQSQVGGDSSIQSGPSEIPKPPTAPTVPNASNDGSITDNPKPTGKSGDGINSENIPSGMDPLDTIFSDHVDLNQVPPFDSNPSGCKTVNFGPAVSLATADGGGNGSRNQNGGPLRERPACSGESSLGTSIFRFPAPEPSLFPFPGRPLENDRPLNGIPYGGLVKRSNAWNDAMVGMVHKGVQCDGCGVHPITGLRYKSKVKEDYDLCSFCFAQIGNGADYIKMDRLAPYRHERSFKGLHNPVSRLPLITSMFASSVSQFALIL
uniref:Uncharacterized protein MANES_06G110100 n=1 Tax=Rhizophora mucronata TaxID=61149 RepID=A0A2P2L8F8_RHIMU